MLHRLARFAAVLLCFALLFLRRNWRHAEVLLVGAILAPASAVLQQNLSCLCMGSGLVPFVRLPEAVCCCPACGEPSNRLHSRYQRRLLDLPSHWRVSNSEPSRVCWRLVGLSQAVMAGASSSA